MNKGFGIPSRLQFPIELAGPLLLALAVTVVPKTIAQDAAPAKQEQAKGPAVAKDAAVPAAVPSPAGETTPDTHPIADSALRLGQGDLLEVSVYNVPELTTKARVGTNGDIYLPLVDYVHVAGLTIEEAQSLIQKRLSDGGFVKDPHVTLFVSEYTSMAVSLIGEVARPGPYPILGQRHLFDLISAAGGLTERAGRVVTITHRNQPDAPVTVTLARNLNESPESNVEILPGDTVIVSKADVVYVVGDVARPSGFMMDSGRLTVLQAIALAGGTTRTSKTDGIKIIRKGPDGVAETPVHLKKILQAKIPDVPLQANDILFVPSSARRIATTRTVDAAISIASTLAIVAVH